MTNTCEDSVFGRQPSFLYEARLLALGLKQDYDSRGDICTPKRKTLIWPNEAILLEFKGEKL